MRLIQGTGWRYPTPGAADRRSSNIKPHVRSTLAWVAKATALIRLHVRSTPAQVARARGAPSGSRCGAAPGRVAKPGAALREVRAK
jgi:hypothetical protein